MDTRKLGAALAFSIIAAPVPAQAAARIAESGRYICADGSSVRFDRRGYGPTLIRDNREIHLRHRWVFFGFRFSGEGIDLRGRGTGSSKRLTLSETGHPQAECLATPAGATPGIVTGRVVTSTPISVPAGARLIVQLRDAARMDAPAPLLGQTEIKPDRHQLPLAFMLRYPAARTASPARPSLSARLLAANGRLLAISDTFTPLPAPVGGRNTDAEIRLRAVPAPSSK